MLQGYKGWIGIIITVFSFFNLFEKIGVTKDETSIALDGLFNFIGFFMIVWGYISAKLRLEKAGKKTDVITETIAGK